MLAIQFFITHSYYDYKGLWSEALEGPGLGEVTISPTGMWLLEPREIDNKRWSLGTMPECCYYSVSTAVDLRVFSSTSLPQRVSTELWQVPLPTNTPSTATLDWKMTSYHSLPILQMFRFNLHSHPEHCDGEIITVPVLQTRTEGERTPFCVPSGTI